jgi:hypothetical protein
MGMESYLLQVKFATPVHQDQLEPLFSAHGAHYLAEKSTTLSTETFQHYYFQVKDDRGLTEIDVLFAPYQVQAYGFTLRFSILSPSTVIDQAFEFLKSLAADQPIRVYDPEMDFEEIPLDVSAFKFNGSNIRKRQAVIDNKTGVIIEGGQASADYIYRNNLMAQLL